MWVPRTAVARRCGAKLLIAHRAQGIALPLQQYFACVDAVSFPYVSRKLKRLIGILWLRYGPDVLQWEREQERRAPVKPELDTELEKALSA